MVLFSNLNIIKLIIIILVLTNLGLTINFNCKINPDINKCTNNTICSDSGLCVCSQYYYGSNCDKVLQNSNTLNIYSTGLSLGSFIGIVVGLSVTFPVFLVGGLLIIYYSLKDRDY